MNTPTGFQTMSSALPDAVNYHNWIVDFMRSYTKGKTMEVGFGHGQYSDALAKQSESFTAVDADPECVNQLGQRLPNIRVAVGDISDQNFPQTVGLAAFDTVVCLNVLEHIKDDVGALTHLRATLKVGGHLLLLVPAHQSLYGPMDKMAGHYRRYSRNLLEERLQSAGYEISSLSFFNPVGGIGWWVNSLYVNPSGLSDPRVNRQIQIFDRYLQPISRFIDPLTRSFFGQSLWAIAKRSAV